MGKESRIRKLRSQLREQVYAGAMTADDANEHYRLAKSRVPKQDMPESVDIDVSEFRQ